MLLLPHTSYLTFLPPPPLTVFAMQLPCRRRTLAAIDADKSLNLVLHGGDLSYADCDQVQDMPNTLRSRFVLITLMYDGIVAT